jgi:hypothetical protein
MTFNNSTTLEFSTDTPGVEPVPLAMLREPWVQALFSTPGTTVRMEAARERVTLTVSAPLPPLTSSVAAPVAVPRSPVDVAQLSRDVWVGLKIPISLRRQFKAVARRLQMHPRDVMRKMIEEFAQSGGVPPKSG